MGERVSVVPAIGCGQCPSCRKGYTNLCDNLQTIGFQFDGGFAEYMEVPAVAFQAGHVYGTPEGVPDEVAALAEPVACVVNGQEFLRIAKGDSVAIFGSGFIGCMHAELARMSGADPVIMIEPNESRAAAAHALIPFSSLIVPGKVDLHAEVKRLTGGQGADVLITACAVGQAQADAVALAAKRGRISLFGGLAKDTKGFLDSNLIHYKELSIHGVHASTARQNRTVMDWIAAGKLDLRKYITPPVSAGQRSRGLPRPAESVRVQGGRAAFRGLVHVPDVREVAARLFRQVRRQGPHAQQVLDAVQGPAAELRQEGVARAGRPSRRRRLHPRVPASKAPVSSVAPSSSARLLAWATSSRHKAGPCGPSARELKRQ